MASNPIKRRARQAFFLGFLLALVIMAAVVMLLFTKINTLNKENEKLKAVGPTVTVYTVNKDIEPGDIVSIEDIQSSTMQLSVGQIPIDVENYINSSSFVEYDEETGDAKDIKYTAKVKIPAGTVVTLPMLKEQGVRNDERIMEYSMISLPTQLVNGDYIDIRFRLANGTETVVLAKKKVEQCTDSTIWIKLTEDEILTMNGAIVDAYLSESSQLRATVYTNPLMQDAVEETYPVPTDIFTQITYNPNIINEAKNALIERWRTSNDLADGRTDFQVKRAEIDNSYTVTPDQRNDKIQSGYEQENTDQATRRSDYVSSLEGSGMVGVSLDN